MPDVKRYSAEAEPKGNFTLPASYDGVVHEHVLWQAVRAFQANQRHGTHSTKTRAEVSGGGSKPWRQKGTGRARQGTTRAPHWRGGGVAFGPKPRSYRIELPRKVRRLARQSAFNARVNEEALVVIESLAFDGPKTKQMVALLDKLGLAGRKVLVLTHDNAPAVVLSGRNLPNVEVMRYQDASPYAVLWADAVVIEEPALTTEKEVSDA
jgi:large subunit ribosomal protein L4